MVWIDIASIVFACVTVNHLGLIGAIENKIGHELPIVNCPKCFTFWGTLAYGLWHIGFFSLPMVLAISSLASYTAIWLELFEGYIDTLYSKFYGTIYPTTDTPDTDALNTADPMSDVSK